MKKTTKILIATSLLLLTMLAIWAGPPLWREHQENKPVTFESTDNYIIKETSEGRIIENKKAGLVFSVPEEWEVEYTDKVTWSAGVDEFGVILKTREIEYNPNSSFISVPMKGCLINVYISHNNRNEYDFTKRVISSDNPPDRTVVKDINSHPAAHYSYGLAEDVDNNPLNFIVKELKVPVNGALYSFETYISNQDKDYCQNKWEEFMENIVIK